MKKISVGLSIIDMLYEGKRSFGAICDERMIMNGRLKTVREKPDTLRTLIPRRLMWRD
jgi:hypothetical protein